MRAISTHCCQLQFDYGQYSFFMTQFRQLLESNLQTKSLYESSHMDAVIKSKLTNWEKVRKLNYCTSFYVRFFTLRGLFSQELKYLEQLLLGEFTSFEKDNSINILQKTISSLQYTANTLSNTVTSRISDTALKVCLIVYFY